MQGLLVGLSEVGRSTAVLSERERRRRDRQVGSRHALPGSAVAMTRLSEYLLPTEKQAPADAEAISHKLMVRAGLVRQMGAGHVDLAAGRLARAPAGRGDHPRGDGRDRRPGDADAGAAAGRAVAQDRAPRDRGAVQADRPQGLGAGARDDPRGGRHLPHRPDRALLPRPAADPLPLPGQGARRAAPARRRAAHARVHHEGLLQLRPRPGGPRGAATRCTSAPTTASWSAPGCASTGSRATSG